MSQQEHTPGPWITDDYNPSDQYRHVMNGNGRCAPYIARLPLRSGDNPTHEQEANARLIAAAPDLLAMLRKCRTMVGHPDNVALIDAAIAKATGGAP